MNVAGIDLAIERLRAAAERVGANLVEVERDPHRQLLEAATLRGTTATRWIAARAALADLFDGYGRMTAFLEQVVDLRGRIAFGGSREADLEALLAAPAIELSSAPVAISERGLLDGSTKVSRCTPDELLARMTNDFEIAKSVIFAVGRVWDEVVPRVSVLRKTLSRAGTRADELADGWPELLAARDRLGAVGDELAEDPLAVDLRVIDELECSVTAIAREIDDAYMLRSEFLDHIAAARGEIDALIDAGRAGRAVQHEAAAKIVSTSGTDVDATAAALRSDLQRIVALADSARWRAAERELEAWRAAVLDARRQIERGEAEARVALDQRDELRGRLDAYCAKAAGLGLAEDGELARMFEAAQRALFTAPTDLARAELLVRRYQDAINAAPGRRASK